MAACNSFYTISDYLKGKVRGINIPDSALKSICADAGLEPDMQFSMLQQKEKDIARAWLYVWMAGGPTQTGNTRDADADWEHSEGGDRMPASVLKQYLSMANDIFEEYDMPIIGEEKWGFVGRGMCNPKRIV